MRVISVNNIPCDTMTSMEVTQIVREAIGTVVVSVADDEIVEPAVKAEEPTYDLSTDSATASQVVPSPTASLTSTDADISAGSNRPPPGKAAGGTWGISKYFGKHSSCYTGFLCLLCFPFCFCMAICPQDERDAYLIDGKVRIYFKRKDSFLFLYSLYQSIVVNYHQVYDAAGKYLGTPRQTRFKAPQSRKRIS